MGSGHVSGYPEPFEQVTGMARIGDPLVQFGRDVEAARATIVGLTRLLLAATEPAVSATLARCLTEPRPGDYVIVRRGDGTWTEGEISWREAFGVLLVARTEQSSAAGPDIPGEPVNVAYVQYGPRPADVTRWVAVTVLKVPVGLTPADLALQAKLDGRRGRGKQVPGDDV